ncbi:ImmA/IrrE family metallo-endopeptidase, partial [Acinetobacter baumannii]|nr:ImmA/IrrE family metallo-endopeptidase [Acinetobacter baumannii]
MSVGQCRGVKVDPLSTVQINAVANKFRTSVLSFSTDQNIDMVDLIENILPTKLGVNYDILEKEVLGPIEAATNPDKGELIIREDVYEALNDPNDPMHGRARFTLAHELGHLILHEGPALHRQTAVVEHKVYEDSEWQADCFAGEFLMPTAG